MWDKTIIKIELLRRGLTLTRVALDAGLSSSACRIALVKSCPAGERALADALNVKVEDIFPERYMEKRDEDVL